MFLARDLEPDAVTKSLGLAPTRAWRRGNRKPVGRAKHTYGGWQRVVPASVERRPIESQLAYWVRTIQSRRSAVRRLSKQGAQCILDVFVISEDFAAALLDPKLLAAVAELGFELHLSFHAYDREKRRAS
jgi:hypothetical protein